MIKIGIDYSLISPAICIYKDGEYSFISFFDDYGKDWKTGKNKTLIEALDAKVDSLDEAINKYVDAQFVIVAATMDSIGSAHDIKAGQIIDAYKAAPYWKEFKRISTYRNFVCRPMKAKLLNKSNVRDVVLNADTDWSVTSCPSWAHVDKTFGSKKTELKVTIDDMPHNQGDRTGEIVFTLNRNDEDGNPITCKYTIEQFDYATEEDAVEILQTHSKGNGIDILFVGDGYDAEDIAKGTYRTDMEQEMEYFFGVEPYKTYRQYFNVSAAMAMSYESGVLDSPDKWRNTKFNVTWGAGNNGRLSVPFEDIAYYVLNDINQSPVTAANVSRSLIICVPNSNAYEGLTAMYTDGSAIAVCPMSKVA